MNENRELARIWFKRAVSNIERAKLHSISSKILYEDLCFDCQQAAEKSLKALLIYHNIEFPKTHSINVLLTLLNESDVYTPDFVDNSIILTNYSVETRYPGDYEPVKQDEYKDALEIAEKVIEWVENKISNSSLF